MRNAGEGQEGSAGIGHAASGKSAFGFSSRDLDFISLRFGFSFPGAFDFLPTAWKTFFRAASWVHLGVF
jgi:hypothetical protein